MRKLMSLLLATMFCVSLSACWGSKEETAPAAPAGENAAPAAPAEVPPPPPPAEAPQGGQH